MTGSIRATRVPYSSDSDEYDKAVDTLDEHAGCYPIRGELRVRMVLRNGRVFCVYRSC